MAKTFKVGDELRAKDGRLLLTFAMDYTAEQNGAGPTAAHVRLADGTQPLPGTAIDAEVMRQLEAAANA